MPQNGGRGTQPSRDDTTLAACVRMIRHKNARTLQCTVRSSHIDPNSTALYLEFGLGSVGPFGNEVPLRMNRKRHVPQW